MGVIKSQVGYEIHIPITLVNRSNLFKDKEFTNLIYKELNYFKFPKSKIEYLNHFNLVMRGYLVCSELAKFNREWRYIEVNSDGNIFCTKLITLKPNNRLFEEALYGKKDFYLNNVPVECLYQYFDHINFDDFIDICRKYATLRTYSYYKSQSSSIITEVITKDYILKQLNRMAIFYLEDMFENKEFFISICDRLKKEDLQKVHRVLIKFL